MIQQFIDLLHSIFEFFTFRRKPDPNDYIELHKEELYI